MTLPFARLPMPAVVEPPQIHLPSPDELPEADVVIYDGQCKFCTGQVQNLARWDGGRRLAFVSLHDPLVEERYPDLTHDMLMEQLYVIDHTGKRYAGAAAFKYLTTRVPRLWALAPLTHIPFSLPLWQWGYRQVAKQRYRWGKIECENACAVHFK